LIRQETCLVILKREDSGIVFIKKLRGLGSGLINFPGGKLENNETPEECAIREAREEVGALVNNPKKVGEVLFELDDGSEEIMHVFLASFYGELRQSSEAIPLILTEPPYENMWPNDKVWLPLVLEGFKVKCKFYFSRDWMEYKGGFCLVIND